MKIIQIRMHTNYNATTDSGERQNSSTGFETGENPQLISKSLEALSILAQITIDNCNDTDMIDDENGSESLNEKIAYLKSRLINAKGAHYGPGLFVLSEERLSQLAQNLSREQLEAIDDNMLDRELYYLGELPEPLEHLDFLNELSADEIKIVLSDAFSRWYLCNLIEGGYETQEEIDEIVNKINNTINQKQNNN